MTTTLISVRWPRLNKQCTLADNDAAIRDASNVSKCRVVKTIALPPLVFDAVGESLMYDSSIWEKIGGAQSDDPEIVAMAEQEGLDGEGRDFYGTLVRTGLSEKFRATCYTPVVEVTAGGRETFYVNTEGYDYARYVGRKVGA